MIKKASLKGEKKTLYKKSVLKYLRKIQQGQIIWNDQNSYQFGKPDNSPSVTITIQNRDFYTKFVWRGSLGAAESYMAGDWQCSDLVGLMQIFIKNEKALIGLEKGFSYAGHLIRTIVNIFNYNYAEKNRRNILRHYDLSNDFFQLFLDKQMCYSSAIFHRESDNIDQAQENKLAIICDKLKLTSSDHLLEIGAGWGGLAIYAAKNYQCKVTTTTISDAQYDYVLKKIRAQSLEDRITLIKKDYRYLDGQYDKIVSIEMIESIGYQYFDKYFAVCDQLLKKGGQFLLQSITINDQEYDRYKREIDFIKTYIFPGGCLPCIDKISSAIKNKTNMRITRIEDFGTDYAKTLSLWLERFRSKIGLIKKQGFSDQFIRMFEFYFCYCQAGFLSSYISVVHITMEKKH